MKKTFLFMFIVTLCFLPNRPVFADLETELDSKMRGESEYFLAKAISIKDTVTEFGDITDQCIKAIGISGSYADKPIQFCQWTLQGIRNIKNVKPNDTIVLYYSTIGEPPFEVIAHYRLPNLYFLITILVTIIISLTGKRGIRAILALLCMFGIIFGGALPLISHGYNALLVLTIASVLILLSSIFIGHGFTLKSIISSISGMVAITLASAIGYASIIFLQLYGTGVPEAEYLQFGTMSGLNLTGLLLGGILVSTVGILDDVTTVQTSTVEQLLHANTSFTKHELYMRAMRVGTEHIISMVNTLFIVFTGAAIPIFLYYLYDGTNVPIWVSINSDAIMEEIVRSLTGSVALVLTVPITTAIATHFFVKKLGEQKPTTK